MLTKDDVWSDEADIVIVGFGGAGAVAAITAHDKGATVLILEKQSKESHYTNTRMSGGVFVNVNDMEKGVKYLQSLSYVEGDLSWTDKEVIQAWAQYASRNKEWMESLGGKPRFIGPVGEHRIDGWECMELYRYPGFGKGFANFLEGQVKNRGIRVIYDAPVKKILTNPDREVTGVRVEACPERRKHTVDIRAKQAVIMTCGGFEFNEEIKLNYLKIYPTHFYGSPANTGDGHRMVMELGADLWHMNCCSARLIGKFPDFPIAIDFDYRGYNWVLRLIMGRAPLEPCGFFFVDRDGKRFTSENIKPHTLYYELALFDSHRLVYPRIPCFWIFDQRRIDSGPLAVQMTGASGPSKLYKWSKDNRKEIEKGWITKADSMGELAEKIGIDPHNLQQTAQTYERYCVQGHDPEFGRQQQDLVPLNNPPYYSVKLFPGGPNTQGGPKRNHRAQILDVDNTPIPRLYAAGEFGSIYGMLYPSTGSNLAECIAFGRIAGENAVKEDVYL
ncbi:MAG: FAD-dependent oxidoreductase [Thermodesulfobacteriota bacterium]|nr:FAD-dependent oxidoreductase [Thermodesulfobacteriota bacterium]